MSRVWFTFDPKTLKVDDNHNKLNKFWLYDMFGLESVSYKEEDNAYLSNRVFDGGYHNAKIGEKYISEWYLDGMDTRCKKVTIVYHFEEIKGEERDPCDLPWDLNHIVNVLF